MGKNYWLDLIILWNLDQNYPIIRVELYIIIFRVKNVRKG